MQQLLSGVHHLHDNWILHRDLKTSNLLLSHRGILKVRQFSVALLSIHTNLLRRLATLAWRENMAVL